VCSLLACWDRVSTLRNPPRREGRKRLGHRYTYGNCDWHHQGYPFNGVDEEASKSLAGPSLAKNPRAFHERFGTEHEIVAMCDELIAPLLSRSGRHQKETPKTTCALYQ
jgi:hypothetical protein